MAKPAKRRVDGSGGDSSSAKSDVKGSSAKSDAKGSSAKSDVKGSSGKSDAKGSSAKSDAKGSSAPPQSRRITPAGTQPGGARSVARPAARKPSPRWVPVLMFSLWGLGLLVIVLNYMQILPGAESGGNGWYLVAGLASILAGIIVATQYH